MKIRGYIIKASLTYEGTDIHFGPFLSQEAAEKKTDEQLSKIAGEPVLIQGIEPLYQT